MTNRNLALLGSALAAAGLFTPIVSFPLVGGVNFFNGGSNLTAVCLLALALIAAVLAAKDRTANVIWPGCAIAGLLLYVFLRLQYNLSAMRASAAKELEGNPFAGLAQSAIGSIQLQWGWIVLGVGAGLLIYAAWSSRAEGDNAFSTPDQLSKGVALASAALLVAGIGIDVFKRGDAQALVPSTGSSVETKSTENASASVEADKPDAEEAAYIREHLHIYDFTAKYYDSMLDGRVPGVEFKIKNDGNRTLDRVSVRVVFQDKDGKPIAEEDYNPVLVSETSFSGDNKPLRPNYIWQGEPDQFLTAKSVPSEWAEGKATASITDVEFEKAK